MTPFSYTTITKSLDDIVCLASEFFLMDEDVIKGISRIRRSVRARQTVWLLAIEHGHGYSSLGRKFNRDHSTIIHGVSVVRGECERDPSFHSRVEKLRSMINAAAPGVRERRKQIVSIRSGVPSKTLRNIYDQVDTYNTDKGAQNMPMINRVFVNALMRERA